MKYKYTTARDFVFMNHRIALEERTGVMKKAKDNVLKDLLGIIGAFLSFYGFFLVIFLLFM